MPSLLLAVISFAACFAIGASLSIRAGLQARNWLPAGVATSLIVATLVYRFTR